MSTLIRYTRLWLIGIASLLLSCQDHRLMETNPTRSRFKRMDGLYKLRQDTLQYSQSYEYDQLNRPVRLHSISGQYYYRISSCEYDEQSRLTLLDMHAVRVYMYGLDLMGFKLKVTHNPAGQYASATGWSVSQIDQGIYTYTMTDTLRYEFNADRQLVCAVNYDYHRGLNGIRLGKPYVSDSTVYTYVAGNVTRVSKYYLYPSFTTVNIYTYEYDAGPNPYYGLHNLTHENPELSYCKNNPIKMTFRMIDATGKLLSTRQQVWENSYDGQGRLNRISVADDLSSTIQTYHYETY